MRFAKWFVMFIVLLLAAVPAFAQQSVTVGASVEGMLTTSQPFVEYTFQSAEAQRVVITLTSNAFDSYLVLFDAGGNEIASDDDGAGNLNSQIGPISVDAGTYTIRATSFNYRNFGGTETTGAFNLSVTPFKTAPIAYGDLVQDQLTSDALTANFTFQGEAGDAVIISMESAVMDTYLILRDSSGVEIASNDDSGYGTNSRIGPFVLPETGEYLIEARSYDRTSTGSYTLSLTRVSLLRAEYGDTLEVRLSGGIQAAAYIVFEGTRGDVINITASGGELRLTLNDPFGTQEASTSGADPEITAQYLYTSGEYMLIVEASMPDVEKAQITLQRSELISLDDGAQTLEFSFDVYEYSLRFTGQAGQAVTVQMNSNTPASPYFEITQGDAFVNSASATNVTNMSFTVVMPNDSDAVLRISEYSGATLTVELRR